MYTMPSIVSFSRAATAVVACALAGLSASAQAQTAQTSANLAGWTFGYAPYTWHYSDAKKENEWEPDEQKHAYVWLLQAEKQLDERQLAGLALFNNSFGQFTQYLYYGWRFQPFDSAPGFYAKLTGGLIHGYREPYHKKIPFNHSSGWGVTAIPAVERAGQHPGQSGADVPGELHRALNKRQRLGAARQCPHSLAAPPDVGTGRSRSAHSLRNCSSSTSKRWLTRCFSCT